MPGGGWSRARPWPTPWSARCARRPASACGAGPCSDGPNASGPGYHFVILDFAVTVPDDCGDPVAGSDAAAAAWVPLDEVSRLDARRRARGVPPRPTACSPERRVAPGGRSWQAQAPPGARRRRPAGTRRRGNGKAEEPGQLGDLSGGAACRGAELLAGGVGAARPASPCGARASRPRRRAGPSTRPRPASEDMAVPAASARRTARSAGTRAAGSGGRASHPQRVGDPAVVEGGDDAGQPASRRAVTRVCRASRSALTSSRPSSSRLTVEAAGHDRAHLAQRGVLAGVARRHGPVLPCRQVHRGAAAPRPW